MCVPRHFPSQKPCRASPRMPGNAPGGARHSPGNPVGLLQGLLNAIAQQSPEARGIIPCPFQGVESCPRMPSGILGFHKGIASPPHGIFQKTLMSSPRIPPGNVPMNWERSPHGLCTRPPGFPKTVAQELTEEFTESHSEICSYLPRIPQGTRPEMPPRMHQTQPGLCTNNKKSPQNLAELPTGVCITCSRVPGRAPGDVPGTPPPPQRPCGSSPRTAQSNPPRMVRGLILNSVSGFFHCPLGPCTISPGSRPRKPTGIGQLPPGLCTRLGNPLGSRRDCFG